MTILLNKSQQYPRPPFIFGEKTKIQAKGQAALQKENTQIQKQIPLIKEFIRQLSIQENWPEDTLLEEDLIQAGSIAVMESYRTGGSPSQKDLNHQINEAILREFNSIQKQKYIPAQSADTLSQFKQNETDMNQALAEDLNPSPALMEQREYLIEQISNDDFFIASGNSAITRETPETKAEAEDNKNNFLRLATKKILQLPQACKQAFIMSLGNKQTYDDIGKKLNISSKQAFQLVKQAEQTLGHGFN